MSLVVEACAGGGVAPSSASVTSSTREPSHFIFLLLLLSLLQHMGSPLCSLTTSQLVLLEMRSDGRAQFVVFAAFEQTDLLGTVI